MTKQEIYISEKEISEIWNYWHRQTEGVNAIRWLLNQGERDRPILWLLGRVEEAAKYTEAQLPKEPCMLNIDEIDNWFTCGEPQPSLHQLSDAFAALARLCGEEGTPLRFLANAISASHAQFVRLAGELRRRRAQASFPHPTLEKIRA
jgi:hypothetical protein